MHNAMQNALHSRNEGAMPHHTTPNRTAPRPHFTTEKVAVAAEEYVSPRDQIIDQLRERGIDNPAQVLADTADADLEAVEGAIRWFDERRKRSNCQPGLLVMKVREGGMPGYGISREGSIPVTPKLLNAIRGTCLSPDGIRRDDVLLLFGDAAERRGMTAGELVDQAVNPRWMETPQHPALLATSPRDERVGRYQAWIGGEVRPDVSVVKRDGESYLSYSMRFWRWEDV